MTSEIIIAAALVVAFAGGTGYSWLVIRQPWRPGMTWLGVVVGCAFTNLIISVILWEITGSWQASLLIPWGCYTLTGVPIILGQILREQSRVRNACNFMCEELKRRD